MARPAVSPTPRAVHGQAELPRVLATVYITPGLLRLSSPRVETLEEAEEKLRRLIGAETQPAERVAAPLPLPFLDADVWTARIPPGIDSARSHELDAGDRRGLLREPVDPPAHGRVSTDSLPWPRRRTRGGETPWPGPSSTPWSGSASSSGAAPRRWRCTRAIPSIASAAGSASTRSSPTRSTRQTSRAPASPSSESLSPDELDDRRLAEAFESAAGLRDDALTCRFAAELARRQAGGIPGASTSPPSTPRSSARRWQRGQAEEALELLARARPHAAEDHRRSASTPGVPRSSRGSGRPAEAAEIYKDLVSGLPRAPQVALDAAETLLDNNHRSHARPFLAQAPSSPVPPASPWVEDRAKALHQARP